MKHLNFSLYDKFVKFVNCVTQFLKVPKCQSVTTFLKRLMGYGLPVTGASGTDEVTLFPRVLSRIVSTQSRFALVLPLLFAFVFILGVGNAWGAVVTLNSFGDNTSGTNYQTTVMNLTDNGSNTWTTDGYRVTNDGLIIGKGGANYLKTPNFANNKITSISVTWSGNANYYLALQTADGSSELEAKQNSSSSSTETFEVSDSYTQLRLVGRRSSGTSNAAATISSVVLTYLTKVTLDKNEGTSDGVIYFDHETTAAYAKSPYATSLAENSSSYTCTGYWTASSGGKKVLNADGTLAAANVAVGTTNYIKSSKWAYTGGTLTLYAQWEEAGGSPCSNEITITKGTPSNGSFEMTGAGTVCIDEGNASVTISDIEPSNGYRFKQITSSGGGDIDNNAKTVSNISANTTINVEFAAIPTHKAYFYNGSTLLNAGGTSFQEGTAVSYGGSAPSSCDTGTGASTSFAGWATATWDGKVAKNAIEPNFYESTLPVMGDEDVTYYAVFCKAGEAGSPTDKFSVDLQVANGNLAAPSGYTLTHASEWKNSSYRQDGSNDPAYVSIYHTSTKLFTTVPSTITVKAELAGGVARDPLNNSVYAVFLDNSGNEIDGSATVLCTSVTTSYVEKTANMPTSKAADAYGIKIRHAKESSYNVRYKSLTLSYATAGASTNYMTTCCTELAQINGSVNRIHF